MMKQLTARLCVQGFNKEGMLEQIVFVDRADITRRNEEGDALTVTLSGSGEATGDSPGLFSNMLLNRDIDKISISVWVDETDVPSPRSDEEESNGE